MSRVKKAPSVHKPPFDEESVLRFAEKGMKKEIAVQGETALNQQTTQKPEEKQSGESEPERRPFTLMLKPETIAYLQQEAFRKGKAVNRIVDKLVAKHLGKI
jgi:hypothetical protein